MTNRQRIAQCELLEHQAFAARLRTEPRSLLNYACGNVRRWSSRFTSGRTPDWLTGWHKLPSGPLDELFETITADTEARPGCGPRRPSWGFSHSRRGSISCAESIWKWPKPSNPLTGRTIRIRTPQGYAPSGSLLCAAVTPGQRAETVRRALWNKLRRPVGLEEGVIKSSMTLTTDATQPVESHPLGKPSVAIRPIRADRRFAIALRYCRYPPSPAR